MLNAGKVCCSYFKRWTRAGKMAPSRSLRELEPRRPGNQDFKAPSAEELDHDFLWRAHKATPGKGMIGLWNRSHYEDVLIVRVHKLVPKKVRKARYDEINRFEEILSENGTTIVKFMLHISKDEQKRRLQARLDRPDKWWKFNPNDVVGALALERLSKGVQKVPLTTARPNVRRGMFSREPQVGAESCLGGNHPAHP